MAQLNITLEQDEILQLLASNRDDAFRTLLENSLNSILQAESTQQLKAEPYERSDERTDSRNGSRERELKTRVGTMKLTVPRHRNVPFKTLIFENYSRSEAALVASMAEMVVSGVSTRKVSNVVETLCGTEISKSAVSEVCKDLDKEVEIFRNRPLADNYPFLIVDATYFKVRENHRIISKALFIALATNEFGHREIIGFGLYPNESKDTWLDFMRSLKRRGLKGLLMITSDAHEGIQYAIHKEFPDVPWQRCQFHFSRNIADKAPKKYQPGLRTELTAMFNSKTLEEARLKRDQIISDYEDIAEAAMSCLEEGFDASMTVMNFPRSYRHMLRTSNHIERLNKELKRRSKVIGVFPNGNSTVRLMGAVLVEIHETFSVRPLLFTEKAYQIFTQETLVVQLRQIAREQESLLAA